MNERYRRGAWIGGTEYVVYSADSDSDGMDNQKAYHVDLSERSCTCKAGQHKSDSNAACAHLRIAAENHLNHPDFEHSVAMEVARDIRDATELLSVAKETLQDTDTVRIKDLSRQEPAAGDSSASEDPPTNDQAGWLREELEGRGFDVEACEVGSEGIEFKVGYHEEFDELKRITSQCDMVGWNGERNVIAPDKIGQYVTEVLDG